MIDKIIVVISVLGMIYCLVKLPFAILRDVKKVVKGDDKDNN